MSEQNPLLQMTVKFFDENGFDKMINIRSDDPDKFFIQVKRWDDWMAKHGYTPRPQSNAVTPTQANGGNGDVPTCPVHHSPMTASNHSGWYCQVITNPNGATKKEKYCQTVA